MSSCSGSWHFHDCSLDHSLLLELRSRNSKVEDAKEHREESNILNIVSSPL